MQTCTIFAAYSNWLTRELEKAEPELEGPARPRTMTADQWRRFRASARGPPAAPLAPEARARIRDNLSDIVAKWEANFSRHLQILLDALNHYAATETVVLLSLCARLSTANQGSHLAGPRPDDDLVLPA